MNKNRPTRLELTWIGKEHQPRLEPRILLEEPDLSYHAPHRVSNSDLFDNMLIEGDNLLALKALEAEYTSKIKCIFIDPPYNTRSAFSHYDDNLEHSLWLTMMRDRLVILRRLLSEDGSLWITIDDNEAHYLKVLCDEIFGRANFLANVIWEKADSPRMDAQFFSYRHDNILVYKKDIKVGGLNKLVASEDALSHYDKIDQNGRRYYTKPLRAMGGQGDSRTARPTLYYPITAPDGTEVYPKKQDGTDGAWRWKKEKVNDEWERIDWTNGKNGWTPYYRIYADNAPMRPSETIWGHKEVGSNRTAKAEQKQLAEDSDYFDTPKPESLLSKIIHIATNVGDIVLDSFAGSGTTGAVAHKMGRRWIMIELGAHARTHIYPRLRKVTEGTDNGGITKEVSWEGGGGFRYYRLAPSLMEQDAWGRWVINKQYNAIMLAEALCKLEGFTYAPSEQHYWMQGYSTERDFIFVTTATLTHEQLQQLSEEVGTERSLLILCPAFRGKETLYPNLTIKKIPKQVLSRCEWGHDDYSLNISALPLAPGQQNLFESPDNTKQP